MTASSPPASSSTALEPLATAHEWAPSFASRAEPNDSRWCKRCGVQAYDPTSDNGKKLMAAACEPPLPLERTLAIKGIKSFRGMEGHGFNTTLYVDGKKLGLVMDDANGGCFSYEFKRGVEELTRWARVTSGQAFEPLDTIVAGLVDAEEERRFLKRRCKKKTLVRLKGHAEGEWLVYSAPYSAELAAQIRKDHGSNLAEIANERKGL